MFKDMLGLVKFLAGVLVLGGFLYVGDVFGTEPKPATGDGRGTLLLVRAGDTVVLQRVPGLDALGLEVCFKQLDSPATDCWRSTAPVRNADGRVVGHQAERVQIELIAADVDGELGL